MHPVFLLALRAKASAAVVLLALLSRAPADADRHETREQREELLKREADVYAEVASSLLEQAILMALAEHETHNERAVLEGHCERSRWRCDNLHARGPWSVHAWCQKAWALPNGSIEARREEARCVLNQFWHGAHRGKEHAQSPLHAGFASLGVRDWAWKGADKRVKTTHEVERLLLKLTASAPAP